MMRIAYISGTQPVAKVKTRPKKDAFMQEVEEAVSARLFLDKKKANEIFSHENSIVEQLKQTLNNAIKTRDEIL